MAPHLFVGHVVAGGGVVVVVADAVPVETVAVAAATVAIEAVVGVAVDGATLPADAAGQVPVAFGGC